jgi:hypothetical protein
MITKKCQIKNDVLRVHNNITIIMEIMEKNVNNISIPEISPDASLTKIITMSSPETTVKTPETTMQTEILPCMPENFSAPVSQQTKPTRVIMCSDCKIRPGYPAAYKYKQGFIDDEYKQGFIDDEYKQGFIDDEEWFSIDQNSDTETEPIYLCCQCDPCGYP